MSVVVVRKPAAECRVQLLIAAGSRSSVHCSDLMSTVAICGMWSGDPALCSSGSTSEYYDFGLYAFKFKYDQLRPATLRYVRQVELFMFHFRYIVFFSTLIENLTFYFDISMMEHDAIIK